MIAGWAVKSMTERCGSAPLGAIPSWESTRQGTGCPGLAGWSITAMPAGPSVTG